MTRLNFLFFTASLSFALSACSPTFNWREVRPEQTRLSALLPCKPDSAQRTVPLGGQATELRLLGCDAGGASFAIAVATLAPSGQAGQVQAALTGWQTASLATIKASSSQTKPAKISGVALSEPAWFVQTSGQRADGRAVQSQAAYFSQGQQLFQAVIYAERISPEMSETFFSNLKLAPDDGR